jgi:hypothetical protein
MHDPVTGGRRRQTDEPQAPKKPAKPAKPTVKEIQHEEVQASIAAKKTFTDLPFPYAPEHRQAYRQREIELMEIYRANKGKCPVCSKPHNGIGIIGHISKCLRTPNSSSG